MIRDIKIEEKIFEPNKIYTESDFKIKIKIERQKYTLEDLQKVKVDFLKNITVNEMKEGIY